MKYEDDKFDIDIVVDIVDLVTKELKKDIDKEEIGKAPAPSFWQRVITLGQRMIYTIFDFLQVIDRRRLLTVAARVIVQRAARRNEDYSDPENWYYHPQHGEQQIAYTEYKDADGSWIRDRKLLILNSSKDPRGSICILHGTAQGTGFISSPQDTARRQIVNALLPAGRSLKDWHIYSPVIRTANYGLFDNLRGRDIAYLPGLFASIAASITRFHKEAHGMRRILICNSQTSIALSIMLNTNQFSIPKGIDLVMTGCFDKYFFKQFAPKRISAALLPSREGSDRRVFEQSAEAIRQVTGWVADLLMPPRRTVSISTAVSQNSIFVLPSTLNIQASFDALPLSPKEKVVELLRSWTSAVGADEEYVLLRQNGILAFKKEARLILELRLRAKATMPDIPQQTDIIDSFNDWYGVPYEDYRFGRHKIDLYVCVPQILASQE